VNGKAIEFKTQFQRSEEDGEVEIRHYWEQEFPASSIVTIEHSYTPIFETGIGSMMPASEGEWGKKLKEVFCASEKEAAMVDKKELKYKPLTYILKTARTWGGPIGRFHLTLSKGAHPHLFLCT
jgi:hypothetical protein